MLDKINRYAAPVLVSDFVSYEPAENEYGFVDLPYVRLIINCRSSEDIEDLNYLWYTTAVTSNSISI